MNISRYEIKWIGRCQYASVDKIWGWFYYNDNQTSQVTSTFSRTPTYTFWAHMNKTINFTRHFTHPSAIDKLVKSKKAVKYTDMDLENLLTVWPNFQEDLDRHFIFFMLSYGS